MRTQSAPRKPGSSRIRRWPRYKVDLPVRVRPQRVDDNLPVQGRGTELNRGGIRVFALLELAMGELVSIEFTPPYSGELVEIRCHVRNRNGHSYGLEFMGNTAADRENVSKLQLVLKSAIAPLT